MGKKFDIFFSLIQEYREKSNKEKYDRICETLVDVHKVKEYIKGKTKSSKNWEKFATIVCPVFIAVIPLFFQPDPQAKCFICKHLNLFVPGMLLLIFLVAFMVTRNKVDLWEGIEDAHNRKYVALKKKETERYQSINWLYNQIVKIGRKLSVEAACKHIEVALMKELTIDEELCSIAIYCKEDDKIKMLDYYGPKVEHLAGKPKMYGAGEIKETDNKFKDFYCVKTLRGEETSNVGDGVIFWKTKEEVIAKLNGLDETTPFSQYSNFLMKLNEKDTLLLEIIVYNGLRLEVEELKSVLLEYAKVMYTVFNGLATNFFDGGSHEGK